MPYGIQPKKGPRKKDEPLSDVVVEVYHIVEQCVLTFENTDVESAVKEAIEMAEDGKLSFVPIDKRFMAFGEPLDAKGKING